MTTATSWNVSEESLKVLLRAVSDYRRNPSPRATALRTVASSRAESLSPCSARTSESLSRAERRCRINAFIMAGANTETVQLHRSEMATRKVR